MMSIEAKIIAVLVALLFGALLFGIGYEYGKVAGKNIVIAADSIKLNQAYKENDELKSKLEVDHENSVKAINTVMSVPIPRVSIPRSIGKTKPSTGSVQTIDPTDVLLGKVETIFSAERQRTLEIVGEAEIELASCNVVKTWAKAQ